MTPPLPEQDLNEVLDRTGSLWEEMWGQRLFITGGTGFFGRWLLESFLWANQRFGMKANVTILTRNPRKFKSEVPHLAFHPAVVLLQGDVRTFEYPIGDYRFLIHGAAEASTNLNLSSPLEMISVIADGTSHVMGFAEAAGVRKALFLSSGAVYGHQPLDLEAISEEYRGSPDTSSPSSAYGEAKRIAELICSIQSFRTGISLPIARCFCAMGAHMALDHSAAGNFVRDCMEGRPIGVAGDGSPVRSYLYGSDLATWLWTILFSGESRRPYNVGSRNGLSIAELAEQVAAQRTPPLPVHIAGDSQARSQGERYVPDTSRAENELSLRQVIGLGEGLRRTLAWYGFHANDEEQILP
jgi:nucleoside-diphosphate-sugar epimerase